VGAEKSEDPDKVADRLAVCVLHGPRMHGTGPSDKHFRGLRGDWAGIRARQRNRRMSGGGSGADVVSSVNGKIGVVRWGANRRMRCRCRADGKIVMSVSGVGVLICQRRAQCDITRAGEADLR